MEAGCRVTTPLLPLDSEAAPAVTARSTRKTRKTALPCFVRLVREPWGEATTPPYLGRIRDPDDVSRILRPLAEAEEVEVFWVLHLDSQSQCRGITEVTRGLLNSSLVHPREVFRV